ncbi:MAG: NAD-dependent epimerase/dehydratase family protein [Candidatus Micrarchaeota archaeon]|nr:NAD-dependent epimerase/dehydratase family protein [Candidatus Micrarchaeota archaeon]
MPELSGLNVVVTGGAGFIGSNLAERLSKENNVTIIDTLHSGSLENLEAIKDKVTFIKARAGEIEKFAKAPDLIFHLGMYSSTPMYREDNMRVAEVVEDSVRLFRYAADKKVKVVFASSSSIYNGHKMPYREESFPFVTDFYTEARYFAERIAELYHNMEGLDAIGLRLFAVYGPHERAKKTFANLVSQFMWSLLEDKPPIVYGDGTQTRDFTYVDDIVDAFLLATRQSGYDVFNAGTSKNYTMNELVSKLNAAMGKNIAPKYIETPIKNYVTGTLADTTKSERVLGFKAKVTLDEGIERLLGYYNYGKGQQ